MPDGLRYLAISSAAAPWAQALLRRAFLRLVALRKISATAANLETIGQPDSVFATLSIGLSTAARKTAHSFSAQRRASGRKRPSPERRGPPRSAESGAGAASVFPSDRRKRTG